MVRCCCIFLSRLFGNRVVGRTVLSFLVDALRLNDLKDFIDNAFGIKRVGMDEL